MALLAAIAAALAASPAIADNQQVLVTDYAFITPGVAVRPGETVTWNFPVGAGIDHHNVTFDDGSFKEPIEAAFAPWVRSRTFSTPGAYPYFCDHHGGPGRQGMAGIVYVNATGTVPGLGPTASFTVSAPVVGIGQGVLFNAAGSTDPDDTILRYEWDLDGTGGYETEGGMRPTTSGSYETAGVRTVRLRVTDGQGHIAETSRTVAVTSPPVAAFSASPSPAQTGQAVSFDASGSSDPDGSIAKYEWDLDGDGSFETDTAATPTASRSYTSAATVTVGLRVTDNLGATAETTRALQVSAPPPAPPPAGPPPTPPPDPTPTPPPAAAPRPASAAAACSALSGARRTTCLQRRCRTLTGARRATCISQSCRYLKGDRRASCVRQSCRYVSRSKRSSCMRQSCRFVSGAKGRACVRKYRRSR